MPRHSIKSSKLDGAGIRRICFDIETGPFSAEFKAAKGRAERLKLVPAPRIVCAFIEYEDIYRFYEPDQKSMASFAQALIGADEVITFNGEGYDFLVLEKHYAEIFKKILPKLKSIDMMLLAQRDMGVEFPCKLDKLARLNFGEGKMVDGRKMSALNLDELKIACKSDVQQTYGLWQLRRNGKIIYPAFPTFKNIGYDEDGAENWPGSQLDLPSICPGCEVPGTLVSVNPDYDEMTEGQAADYEAGWRHDLMCRNCQMIIIDGDPIGRLPELLQELGIKEGSDLSNTILSPVLEKSLTIANPPCRPRRSPTLVPFDQALGDARAHERRPFKPLIIKKPKKVK